MIGGVRFEQPVAYVITIGDIENRNGKRLARWTDSFSIYHAEHDDSGQLFRRAVEVEKDLVERGFGRWLNEKKTAWRLERVPIILQFNELTLNFNSYYALYGSGGSSSVCWCSCRDFDPQKPDNIGHWRKHEIVDGKRVPLEGFEERPCPCKHLYHPVDNPSGKCHAYARLIGQIQYHEVLGGIAVFRTRGYHIINRIYSSLYTMGLQLRGHVAGVPMQLVVKVVRKSDGKLTKRFPVVELTSQPLAGKSFLQVLREAAEVPAIDERPEVRDEYLRMLSDRTLALPEASEIAQVQRFLAPEATEELPANADEPQPATTEPSDEDVIEGEYTESLQTEDDFSLEPELPFDPIEVKRAELQEAGWSADEIETYLKTNAKQLRDEGKRMKGRKL